MWSDDLSRRSCKPGLSGRPSKVCASGAVLMAFFATVVGAGCGAHSPRQSAAGASGSLQALLKRPGEDVSVVAGDSDFAPGVVRFSFLVIRHDARPVERERARVWLARSQFGQPFERATARLETVGPPGGGEAAFGGIGRIYVVELRVPRPGRYWLVAEPVGARIQALGTLDVKRRSDSRTVGAKAPASATPTLASVHGAVRKLTTRVPPDRSLLRYSIAGSLAAHRPFVVTFATPRYCTSRTCGPVVDVVEYVRRRLAARGVRFIHVEVYRRNRPALGYNRWMRQWGLHSEPWTFLVGRDGRIKAKFEGSLSARELEAAVRRLLL
jgi:hypothetical protein